MENSSQRGLTRSGKETMHLPDIRIGNTLKYDSLNQNSGKFKKVSCNNQFSADKIMGKVMEQKRAEVPVARSTSFRNYRRDGDSRRNRNCENMNEGEGVYCRRWFDVSNNASNDNVTDNADNVKDKADRKDSNKNAGEDPKPRDGSQLNVVEKTSNFDSSKLDTDVENATSKDVLVLDNLNDDTLHTESNIGLEHLRSDANIEHAKALNEGFENIITEFDEITENTGEGGLTRITERDTEFTKSPERGLSKITERDTENVTATPKKYSSNLKVKVSIKENETVKSKTTPVDIFSRPNSLIKSQSKDTTPSKLTIKEPNYDPFVNEYIFERKSLKAECTDSAVVNDHIEDVDIDLHQLFEDISAIEVDEISKETAAPEDQRLSTISTHHILENYHELASCSCDMDHRYMDEINELETICTDSNKTCERLSKEQCCRNIMEYELMDELIKGRQYIGRADKRHLSRPESFLPYIKPEEYKPIPIESRMPGKITNMLPQPWGVPTRNRKKVMPTLKYPIPELTYPYMLLSQTLFKYYEQLDIKIRKLQQK